MYLVVFVTTPNKKEAKNIAGALIKKKLAACVNILDQVASCFWWQGKIDQAEEVLLVIKTKRDKLKQVIRLVKSLHSYEVPEVIALPIIGGEKRYLRWIDESIR